MCEEDPFKEPLIPGQDDGGGQDWLLQEAGGLRGLPADEGFQYWGQLEGGGVELLPDWTSQIIM